MSSWIQHCKDYSKEHGISYKEALKQASSSYKKVEGGSLKSNELKKLISATYDDNHDVDNFEIDNDLSGKRFKAWKNNETGQVVVGHRGSNSLKDWATNAGMSIGIESGNRFKHGKKMQEKAQNKYGAENITTVSHSLGSKIAQKYGDKSFENITLNKPTLLQDYGRKVPKNEFNIRSKGDVVSALNGLQNDKKLTTLKSRGYNPLIEHKPSILNRKPLRSYGK